MISFLTGLAAGCSHVFAGPDHLLALAPLAAESRARALRTGAAWGLGHGLGVVILGAVGMLARGIIDVEAVAAWSEVLVGFTLMGIGLWAVRRFTKSYVHVHTHGHEGDEHAHFHLHDGDVPHEAEHAHRGHTHAAFGVGVLHGAAGTGHLFGVIPSLALPPLEAGLFLTAYLIAAVVSMAGFGFLLGKLSIFAGVRARRWLVLGSGAAAFGLGIFWVASGWPTA